MKPRYAPRPSLLVRALLLPLELLSRIPPGTGLIVFLLMIALGFGVFAQINSDFLGLLSPPLAKLVFSSGNETVRAQQPQVDHPLRVGG